MRPFQVRIMTQRKVPLRERSLRRTTGAAVSNDGPVLHPGPGANEPVGRSEMSLGQTESTEWGPLEPRGQSGLDGPFKTGFGCFYQSMSRRLGGFFGPRCNVYAPRAPADPAETSSLPPR